MHRKVIEVSQWPGYEGPVEYEAGPIEFSETDLQSFPEVDNVVFSQDNEWIVNAIDSQGKAWMIKWYQGNLCKQRIR